MRYSQMFGKTTRDISKEEVSKNAQLLIRGGFVDKLQAGVYSFLPLGLRVLQKVEQIIREEMNAVGGQEILMPALHPKANWVKTGRWDEVDVLFKFESFYTKIDYVLGATHEEVVTPLAKKFVKSYRDLPVAVYQFQTKFRDEKRAKSGIMRGREFRMKDLYSFHADEKDMDKYYDEVSDAYVRVFERLGLGEMTFKTFASGGTFCKFSHEFQTVCETGEDTIFLCEKCKTGHNKEVFDEKLAEEGVCVECGNKDLKEVKACEVGNIFKLKNKFSDVFDLKFTDEDGKEKPVLMSCFGMGPSRVMGVIAEVWNDEKGLMWPESVAPFDVEIVTLGDDVKVVEAAISLQEKLEKKGVEVLIDERDERAGVKFADADLMGIPVRVVMGGKVKKGEVEVKMRNEDEVKMMKEADFVKSFDQKKMMPVKKPGRRKIEMPKKKPGRTRIVMPKKAAMKRVVRKRLPPLTPEEKFEWKEAGKAGIAFWCRECGEMIDKPEGKVGAMKCPKCGKRRVVFGTQKSVQNWTSRRKKDGK